MNKNQYLFPLENTQKNYFPTFFVKQYYADLMFETTEIGLHGRCA